MKQLIILLAALLALGACGQEEEAQAPVEDEAQVEAEAPEAVADEAEAAVEETLEVVEESAAVEEESADEPIILAQADSEETAREWKFKENQDYRRLVPTQPTVGGADKIVDLPGRERNHHWTKNVIASADGRYLYVAVGSNSNIGENGMAEEVDRAAILEVDPQTRSYRLFAGGLRNPVGMDWEPTTDAL